MKAISPAIEYLKQFPNWVCWKDDGRKVPVNPITGGNAMPNLSTTWGTYQQALNRYKRDKAKLKGLGFMFSKEVGIVGIDLDNKPDPVFFDGELTRWAYDVVKSINSYAELSPSGNGLHILAFGEIPHNIGSKDNHGVEMYDHVRWFTITGKHLTFTPDTIEERQNELITLHSKYTTRKEYAPQAHVPIDLSNIDRGEYSNYVKSALEDECHKIATAPHGCKENTRFSSSANIGDLVGADWCDLDYNTAFNALMNAAMSNTTLTYEQIAKTITNGLNKGMSTPRPLPQKQQQNTIPQQITNNTPPPPDNFDFNDCEDVVEPSKPEIVTITHQELNERLEAEYWRGYHDGMTDAQRQSWLTTGIPDNALDYVIDNFSLGFRPETIDIDTGEIQTNSLSIPFFTGNDTANVEYRCLDSGLVTYELNAPVLYNTTKDTPTNHVCILDDSIDSIKAWLQFGHVEVGSSNIHFMALPKTKININCLDALLGANYIYVIAGKDTPLKGRGLELLRSNARFIRLPMATSDTFNLIDEHDFLSLLRSGDRW